MFRRNVLQLSSSRPSPPSLTTQAHPPALAKKETNGMRPVVLGKNRVVTRANILTVDPDIRNYHHPQRALSLAPLGPTGDPFCLSRRLRLSQQAHRSVSSIPSSSGSTALPAPPLLASLPLFLPSLLRRTARKEAMVRPHRLVIFLALLLYMVCVYEIDECYPE